MVAGERRYRRAPKVYQGGLRARTSDGGSKIGRHAHAAPDCDHLLI
jgi:hypothetical protein